MKIRQATIQAVTRSTASPDCFCRQKWDALERVPTGAGQRAYTVAEAMIGVAVMALMLIALLAGMSSGYTFTQLAREDLRATQILLEKMEIIRLYSWDQINGSNSFVIPTAFTNTYYPPGLGSSGGITFNGTLSILPVSFTNAVPSSTSLLT